MAKESKFSDLNIQDYSNFDFVGFNIISDSNIEYGKVSRVLGSNITSLLEVQYLEKSYLIPINNPFLRYFQKESKPNVEKNWKEFTG